MADLSLHQEHDEERFFVKMSSSTREKADIL